MAATTITPPKSGEPKPAKPKTLKSPLRRRVKRYGKRLTRWVSAYLSRQGLVPDTPFVDTAHFPFLKDFEARFEAATRRASENLEKLSDL